MTAALTRGRGVSILSVVEPLVDDVSPWPPLAVLLALVLAGACVHVPSAQVCAGVTAPLTSSTDWRAPSANASVCVDVARRGTP